MSLVDWNNIVITTTVHGNGIYLYTDLPQKNKKM